MHLIKNISLRLRQTIDVLSVPLNTSPVGVGHHLPPDSVTAICPPLTLVLVHKWQPLSDGWLLSDTA
jgi:hypothetical protein